MKKIIGAVINSINFFVPQKATSLVHHLFATPRKGKLKEVDLPLFIKKSNTLKLRYKNKEVFCYEWKTNNQQNLATILLIHGWESNSARWEELVNYLGQNYRFIAFDAPSLGQSPGGGLSVKDYQNCIDLLINHFQPTYVVAHSLGAFALYQQLAATNYSSIQKVVLLGCLDRFEIIVNYYFSMFGYSSQLRQQYYQYLSSLFELPLSLYTSSEATSKVDKNILCIHDTDDEIIFYNDVVSFHQLLKAKQNHVIVTSGIDHRLQNPIVFKTIKEFLTSK